MPQDPEHFALALYENETKCPEVLFPSFRHYDQELKLDFVDVNDPRAWAFAYHVCTDTTWTIEESGERETIGPVDTYVFWYNPCNMTQSITFNSTRLDDGASPHRQLPD
jgi:hypothetical protein